MTTTQELLKSSFELNLSNYGPEDVERLNDWAINAYAALEAAQAENAQWRIDFKEMVIERDAALARLAEIEAQESVATVLLHEGEKIIDGTMAFMDTAWLGMPLFAAAGASLVATPVVAWAKSTPRKLRITTMDMGREDGWRPLGYMAAGTSPVEPSLADAQDAARYRWLRSTTNWASNSSNERIDVRNSPELWDAAITAAINAKGR